MIKDYMFTSESVTAGHPDKLCDQISDAIVDHILLQDPCAAIRAECAVSNAIVFIAAHFATTAKVDLPHLARKVIKRICYDRADFNSKTCSILTAPQGLSPKKSYQFDERELSENDILKIHAKNQVTVFGYACDQTPDFMPLPIWLANRLTRRLDDIRMQKILPYLTPDGKVQVGVEYKNHKPHRIHSVTLTACQKEEDKPSPKTLTDDIIEHVVNPVFKDLKIKPDQKTRLFVNPDGPNITGGPSSHSGLTGRKSDVDTYGEYSRHSGDALSGKDPMRIDRIGAYAARHAAKNIVAAGLAPECEVTLSYAIGLAEPVSLQIHTVGNGTCKIDDSKLAEIVSAHFDFRLGAILKEFDLRRLPSKQKGGFFERLACYGHMGRTDLELPWEKTEKVEALASEAV